MRGVTHTLLGAAVALPIAVSREPAIAAGCLWLGTVGAGLPDWLDFRSDVRAPFRLRHRGVSHSVLTLVVSVALFCVPLVLLQRDPLTLGDLSLAPNLETIAAWCAGLALGLASHLAADACTHAGIQPWLPFSRRRMWLLPRPLRSRYDGYLDRLFGGVATVALAFGILLYAGRWIAIP